MRMKVKKKFSSRRETARCYMSLKVTEGHSRSFETTHLCRACISRFHCNYLYLVPFPKYSVSNNGVTLKYGWRSFKVIKNGTIRQLGYGFLFAFYSNYHHRLLRQKAAKYHIRTQKYTKLHISTHIHTVKQ